MGFRSIYSAQHITNRHPAYTEHSHWHLNIWQNMPAKFRFLYLNLYLFPTIFRWFVLCILQLKARIMSLGFKSEGDPRQLLKFRFKIIRITAPEQNCQVKCEGFWKEQLWCTAARSVDPISAENEDLSEKLLLTSHTDLSSRLNYSLL